MKKEISSRLFLLLVFLSFSPWLIKALAGDISSEQDRKLKIAAPASFPFHLVLLLWDLKYAKLQVQLVRAANG